MERRKYPRIRGIVKFFYKPEFSASDKWINGLISNLSLSGAFVRLPRKIPIGIKISVRMPLEFIKRGTTICHLPATVVRHVATNSRGETLMGVMFEKDVLGVEDEKIALSRYIKEQQDRNKAGKAKFKSSGDQLNRQKKMEKLMEEANDEVDDEESKEGFFSKIFGKG